MSARGKSGFSLLEIVVGLALGSALVLLVHQAFGASADIAARLERDHAVHEREMAGRRTLERLLAGLEVGAPRDVPVVGTATSFRFSSNATAARAHFGATDTVRLEIADGWLLRTHGNAASARLLPLGRARFQYLAGLGEGAAWVEEWESLVSAPLALRILVESNAVGAADTILLVIGPRG